MSFIIGNKCIGCVDGSCLKVCPVDCINGPIDINLLGNESMTLQEKQGLQLFINPDVCINCGACVPECPVDAIYRNEKEAILYGDEISIHKNYEYYGQNFS
jgi:NAD-dependent dihydropyrimidine dehydrogenase PreA subunit